MIGRMPINEFVINALKWLLVFGYFWIMGYQVGYWKGKKDACKGGEVMSLAKRIAQRDKCEKRVAESQTAHEFYFWQKAYKKVLRKLEI